MSEHGSNSCTVLWIVRCRWKGSEMAPSFCCSRSAISSQEAVQTQLLGFCQWDPIHPAKTTRKNIWNPEMIHIRIFGPYRKSQFPKTYPSVYYLPPKEYQSYDSTILSLLELQPHLLASTQACAASKLLLLPVHPILFLQIYLSLPVPDHLLQCFASPLPSCPEFLVFLLCPFLFFN